MYEELVDRLPEAPSVALTAFPDGSVDTFYRVSEDSGDVFASREAFAETVAAGATKSYEVEAKSRDPGGQSVNVARQWHALGAEVTLYGHLDDAVFASLPFETLSMGDPTRVSVFEFADGDFFFAEESQDIHEWELADLRDVAGNAFPEVLERPAVCCVNWVSCGEMTAQIAALAERDLDGGVFAFDPGDVTGASQRDLRALLDALSALDDDFDVVVSLNENEADAVAAAVRGDAVEPAVAIRDAAAVTGVVVHGTEAAVAATADGPVRVPQQLSDAPRRQTGGGDRFTAGLAHGLALGWDWDLALALGNAVASYYVTTGETGTVADVVEHLSDR